MSVISDEELCRECDEYVATCNEFGNCSAAKLRKADEELAALRDELERVKMERDELANRAREVTCVWCGHHFVSTLRSQAEHLYEHAKTCEKHPVRIAETKLATAEARCGELEAALRPFAEAAESVRAADGISVRYVYFWKDTCRLIGNDFRRAAALVARLDTSKGQS